MRATRYAKQPVAVWVGSPAPREQGSRGTLSLGLCLALTQRAILIVELDPPIPIL